MSFAIRPEENEDDRAFIRGLNARLTQPIEAPAHSREEVVAFQDRFTASAWTTNDGATFIAVRGDGRRLGYVNVRGGADEIANERCGYVALLAVVAEAEGEGVGQALLREAEAWCQQMGYARLALDVFASNDRALQFYERAGFRPETIRVIKRL
jgi:GNAT superfamily N-acetyltransferase